MSRTYDLGCDDCNVCIWMGQSTSQPPGFYVYAGDGEWRTEIAEFLLAHQGHALRFFDTEHRPDDWEELRFMVPTTAGLKPDKVKR